LVELNLSFSEKERSRNVAKGALAAIVTQFVRIATQVGSVVVLSRLLTPADFGVYAMASPVLAFVVLFQDFGLGHATVQKEFLTQKDLSSLFWVNLSAGISLAVGLVILSPLVGIFYNNPKLAALTSAMSCTLILSGADVQHLSLLTRQMRFWTLALLESAAALSGFLTSCVLALIYHNYWAILAGSLASGVALAGGAWLSSGWLPSKPGSIKEAKSMLNFGMGVTGFNFAEFVSRNADSVLIGKYWGEVPLGLYNRAYRLLLFPLQQVTNPMIRVMLPTLSRLVQEPEKYREAFLRAVFPAFLVVLPGVAFMIATADFLVPIVLGSRWADVAPTFVGLGMAGLLQTMNSPASWLFLSQGRTREYMLWGFFSAATSVSAFVCGLPYGPLGVAIAYSISEVLRTPILWWIVGARGPVGRRDILRMTTPHFLGAIASLAVVYLLHRWMLNRTLLDISICLILSYAVSLLLIYLFPASRREFQRYLNVGIKVAAPEPKRI
jgi:polysaccharide transporter, PST family